MNKDNAHFEQLAQAAREVGAEIVSFGFAADADARAEKVALHAECVCVAANVRGHSITYKLRSPGRHWARNSLAVLAVVNVLGADLSLAALALGELTPSEGRGRRHSVEGWDGSFVVIDDSYNASPASVRAALEVLGAADVELGRRIAVLGDMLELGPGAEQLHEELAVDVASNGVAHVFTAGPHMRHLFEALPRNLQANHAETAADLLPSVTRFVKPGDVVLVKGSFASAMGQVVEGLLDLEAQRRAAKG